MPPNPLKEIVERSLLVAKNRFNDGPASKVQADQRIPNPSSSGFADSQGADVASEFDIRETVGELVVHFRETGVNPALIHAFATTGRLVSEENKHLVSHQELQEWRRAVRGYGRKLDADSKAVDLCFRLLHRAGNSGLAAKKRFLCSELGVAVLNALEEGVSSFAMEGVFFNAWLNAVCQRIRVPMEEREGLREHFGAESTELRQVLDQAYDELPLPSWNDSTTRKIVRIESARSAPETWLGKPPASLHEARWEMGAAIEHLSYALHICAHGNLPDELMESMFFRSRVRLRVLNERTDERAFQSLDEHWDRVYAKVQLHMARYSGVPLQ